MKLVRPAVEQTRQGQTKNPDVDRLEEDCNRYVMLYGSYQKYTIVNLKLEENRNNSIFYRLNKRWGNVCMQVVERLRSCEAALELLEKYQVNYQSETNWMDELDSKLKNLEELEAARAKEAWEKHVVSLDIAI